MQSFMVITLIVPEILGGADSAPPPTQLTPEKPGINRIKKPIVAF